MKARYFLIAILIIGARFPVVVAGDELPAIKPAANEQHQLFTQLLAFYVHNGRVDYEHLRHDERLDQYLAQLVNTDPEALTDRNERFAFWLNAYNAYTLKIICDNYPLKSINKLSFGGLYIGSLLGKTVWDKDFVEVNHTRYTLNEIEHEVIRPGFKDARAHFALVCASRSCPPLRSEAYEGHLLDKQLDNQGEVFFAQSRKNRFDLPGQKAQLSPILDWFNDDFGGSDREALLYATRFLPADLALAIRRDIKDWKVKYRSFNWRLND